MKAEQFRVFRSLSMLVIFRLYCIARWVLCNRYMATYGDNTMYHSPIRQTFELGKFITSTAGKNIINVVKL